MKKIFDLFASNTNEYLECEYKHSDLSPNEFLKIKKKRMQVASYDLHGMRTVEAEKFISNCIQQHPENCIIEVIHGIGTQKLQQHMRHYLKNHARVYAYWQPHSHTQAKLHCYLVTEKKL